jgi:hypothetical protein
MRGEFLQHDPRAHDADPRGDLAGPKQIVSSHKDSDSFAGETLDQATELVGRAWVEAAGRLVQKQGFRLLGERDGYADLLAPLPRSLESSGV